MNKSRRKFEQPIRSVLQLMEALPENERIILDVLRQIAIDYLGDRAHEKLAYGVPYFYGKRGICIIWPASITRGGVREGVLFGFWQGNRLKDEDGYLIKGNNKKIYYRIYTDVDAIDEPAIGKLLREALALDRSIG